MDDSGRIQGLEEEIEVLRQQVAELEAERDSVIGEATAAVGVAATLELRIEELELVIERLGLRHEPRAFAFDAGEGCEIGTLPGDWKEVSVQVGPLWLLLLGDNSTDEDRDLPTQTIAILEPGQSITLVVAEAWRDHVAHLYDPSTWNQDGRYSVVDGRPAVTFRSCPDSMADFPGGFVYRPEARCAPFDVYVGEEGTVRRVVLPLDRGECPETLSAANGFVTSLTIDGLGSSRSSVFAFEAPDPKAHTQEITVVVSPAEAAMTLEFLTADGATLHVVTEDSDCGTDDGRKRCIVNFPILEARDGGVWKGTITSLTEQQIEVDLRIEFNPAD